MKRRYFRELRAKCAEDLLYAVLKKLSRTRNFIPAQELRSLDLDQAALEEMLCPVGVPWFKFKDVRLAQSQIEVDVSHGIPLAAIGETFVYRVVNRQKPELRLVKRYQSWIS